MHSSISAPKAAKKTVIHQKHGDQRPDDYYWLRERENPEVIQHLIQENAYTEACMKSVEQLKETIFQEMKSRVKEDDSSAPVKDGAYYYGVRYEPGQQYPLYVRYAGSPEGREELLLNLPLLSEGHSYYSNTGPRMSSNHEMMAYAVDTVGRRFYNIHFKNVKTGEVLPETIENVTGNLTWASDNETIFYAQQDPETLRSNKIYRYNIKTKKTDLVYFEEDETFSCFVYKSVSRHYVFIGSYATLSSEIRYVRADRPYDAFQIFAPREKNHEYSVTDGGEQFYIVTNKDAKNFRLMTAQPGNTDVSSWKELIPHSPEVLLDNVLVLKDYLVLDERKNGQTQLRITDRQGKNPYTIPFADASYLASVGDNREYDTQTFRFEYESMRLPPSTYDLSLKDYNQRLVKRDEVPNYDEELYRTERIFVTARDGAQVPVSLLMKKDQKLDGSAPLLIYAYGSYGANMDPWFSSNIFSLIDRGFVFAKANIRGGSEMGRDWYENGRTQKKKNTFYDFIDCTEALVQQKYAHRKRVYAMGGSAGGLLMGAVMNMRPDLYHGVVAQVPFVDVITTMLDDSIPLTTSEYDEWGNPNEKAAYDYIKSYSPYDNVTAQKYPHTLITTGLHDSQVQYWEPAKWVQKLREYNKGNTLILLKTDMEAGHGGASGRFNRLKDIAEEYAFILMIDTAFKN